MRVLLVNHEFSMSGAAVMLLEVADLLLARGHELSVGAMDPAAGPLRTEYERRGVPLLETARAAGFDLMIANTLSAAPAVLSLAPALPTVWWLHETDFALDMLARSPEWRGAFDLAHRIVIPSAWMRDNIYRSFLYRRDVGDVWVVPNGIRPWNGGVAESKRRPFRIVCCGTIHIGKRQGDLIAALDRLDRDDVELVLIGLDVILPDEARRMIDRAPDRFRILGQRSRDEARSWIASADLVALVSQSENHALSIGEAAFAGVPVVLSDLPVFLDQGWRHGETCLMHPVGNVAMLADNIGWLLDHEAERRRLGQAVGRMRRGYSFEAFVDGMGAVIGSLVPGPVL